MPRSSAARAIASTSALASAIGFDDDVRAHLAGEHVFRDAPHHIHGVLRRRIRRGIRKIEPGQLRCGHSAADGRGRYVYALVHALEADNLRAQQPAFRL